MAIIFKSLMMTIFTIVAVLFLFQITFKDFISYAATVVVLDYILLIFLKLFARKTNEPSK